jgi:DNA replication and repair protein RecF
MLQLDRISFTQFKNYHQESFEFQAPVIAISGKNGAGKTNLLDGICYLSLTRSYFGGSDSAQIKTGFNGFRIEGKFQIEQNTYHTNITLRETGKKEVGCEGLLYEKFSEHIGKFPVVMIAPDDIELINGSPETRRKFIDTILCQTDTEYLQHLIVYNKILQQRNSYLKQSAITKHRDNILLDTFDKQLSDSGTVIYNKRKAFIPDFRSSILSFYDAVAGITESPDFKYESQLHETKLQELLQSSRDKDYITQRTSCGIHKDNPEILLSGETFKSRGSQGQKKSMLFALKLAEASCIEARKGFSPILLLDDVFEKLDAHRMQNLLSHICHNMKAQIFLTDTHTERISEIFKGLGKEIQNIYL